MFDLSFVCTVELIGKRKQLQEWATSSIVNTEKLRAEDCTPREEKAQYGIFMIFKNC